MHPSILHMNNTLRDKEYMSRQFIKSLDIHPDPVRARTNPYSLAALEPAAEALRTLDQILKQWRDANQNAHIPKWYKLMASYCAHHQDQAAACASLFVGYAGEETDTQKLAALAVKAVKKTRES